MQKLFFSILLALTSTSSLAQASFQSAIMTTAIATELQKSKLSNEFRQTLLANATTADQSSIKNLVSRWKKISEFSFQAEFDHLVMFDKAGNEAFRIFPKPNSSGTFYINGREWVTPKDGLVYKSLNQFFAETLNRSSSSIFEIMQHAIAKAHAQADGLKAISQKVAYFYVTHQVGPEYFVAQPPKIAILEKNPSAKMLNTQGTFLERLFRSAKDVQCTSTGAKGRVLIGKEPLEFQTTSDGRVLFRMFNEKRTTFQAKSDIVPIYEQRAKLIQANLSQFRSPSSSSIQRDSAAFRLNMELKDLCRISAYAQTESVSKFCENPEVIRLSRKRISEAEAEILAGHAERAGIPERLSAVDGPKLVHAFTGFTECADPTCSKLKSETESRAMTKWIGEEDSTVVGIALNHVPRDQRDLGYVIDFDCPKDTKCENIVLKKPELLNPKSRAEAETLLAAAKKYYTDKEVAHRNVANSLAPLHGCCADETCRRSSFGDSLILTGESQQKSKGQSTSK